MVVVAKAAAGAAADAAKATQELLNLKNEDRRYFSELTNLLSLQAQELRFISNAMNKIEGKQDTAGIISTTDRDREVTVVEGKKTFGREKDDLGFPAVSSSSVSPDEPPIASHPKSFVEIMEMIQRGERPSNIKDVNDLPPNPDQKIPFPTVPRTKPWEVDHLRGSSTHIPQFQGNGVLGRATSDGAVHRSVGNMPWQPQQHKATITEIESEHEQKSSPFVRHTNKPHALHAWVPPQPPAIVMPEAAEAIRHTNSASAMELADDRPGTLLKTYHSPAAEIQGAQNVSAQSSNSARINSEAATVAETGVIHAEEG